MLTIIDRVIALARSVLAEAPTAGLARLASLAEEVILEPGESLWEAGTPADRFPVLLDGEIGLLAGRREVAHVHAGQLVDLAGLIRAGPRAHTAVALAPSLLLCVEREDFWQLLGEEGELGRILLAVLAGPPGDRQALTP